MSLKSDENAPGRPMFRYAERLANTALQHLANKGPATAPPCAVGRFAVCSAAWREAVWCGVTLAAKPRQAPSFFRTPAWTHAMDIIPELAITMCRELSRG